MLKSETSGPNGSDLYFAKSVASILLKDVQSSISSRAVFVLLSLYEDDKTKDLVKGEIKAHKAAILKKAKQDKSAGLQILAKKLSE